MLGVLLLAAGPVELKWRAVMLLLAHLTIRLSGLLIYNWLVKVADLDFSILTSHAQNRSRVGYVALDAHAGHGITRVEAQVLNKADLCTVLLDAVDFDLAVDQGQSK